MSAAPTTDPVGWTHRMTYDEPMSAYKDAVVECSCGFRSEVARQNIGTEILEHRLDVIEKGLGIVVAVESV